MNSIDFASLYHVYVCIRVRVFDTSRLTIWLHARIKIARRVDYLGGAKSRQAKLGTPDGRVARTTHCRGHRESCHLEARSCCRGSQEASRARGEKVPIVLIFFPS